MAFESAWVEVYAAPRARAHASSSRPVNRSRPIKDDSGEIFEGSDRATGEVHRGEVPAYSVVVPGALPSANGGPSLYCAVIVKQVDAQTRSKTSVNELLRD